MLRRKAPWAAALVVCLLATSAAAQTPVTVSLDTVFFGDNAEFFSPFRTGETILGTWQRLNTDIVIGKYATLRVGAYALERDGSDRRSELARPVASLTMGTPRHRFIIGTLETGERPWGVGPDRTTPHGVLPPLAIETDWFNRAYEAGIQWKTNTEHVVQDVWFDYQKVITAEHRELFDSGFVGMLQKSPTAPIALVYQMQVVHHGGQQFDNGTVSDSFGWGPGVLVRKRMPAVGVASAEFYGLGSYDRPDRQKPELTLWGKAAFLRVAAEQEHFRVHALAWRGRDFRHESGDPNYLSQLPDGTTVLSRRDYFEMGLTLPFKPAPTVSFEVSGRAHLVQGKWGYSYRLLGSLHLKIWHTEIDGQ